MKKLTSGENTFIIISCINYIIVIHYCNSSNNETKKDVHKVFYTLPILLIRMAIPLGLPGNRCNKTNLMGEDIFQKIRMGLDYPTPLIVFAPIFGSCS